MRTPWDEERRALDAHDPERKTPHIRLYEAWLDAQDCLSVAGKEYSRLAGDPGDPQASPPREPRKPEGSTAEIQAAWGEVYRWWNAAEQRMATWLRAVESYTSNEKPENDVPEAK